MQGFRIHDPYRRGLRYSKAQLHTHSEASIDSKWKYAELVLHYAGLGFGFVCISDHDRVTLPVQGYQGPEGVVTVSAEESMVVHPVWPLGRHLLRLFVGRSGGRWGSRNPQALVSDALSQGGMVAACHPSWKGNFGLGGWTAEALIQLKGYRLIEVCNHHSDPDADTGIWDRVLVNRGPSDPLWAVAVDDAHHPGRAGAGWVEVQADEPTADGLRIALERGSFYATTGLALDFGAEATDAGWRVWVRRGMADVTGSSLYPPGSPELECTFIADGSVVSEAVITPGGTEASYMPTGAEAYVRVAVRGGGRRAWSQPFWLMPVPGVGG